MGTSESDEDESDGDFRSNKRDKDDAMRGLLWDQHQRTDGSFKGAFRDEREVAGEADGTAGLFRQNRVEWKQRHYEKKVQKYEQKLRAAQEKLDKRREEHAVVRRDLLTPENVIGSSDQPDYDSFSPMNSPRSSGAGRGSFDVDHVYDLLSPTNSIHDADFPTDKFQQVYRSIQMAAVPESRRSMAAEKGGLEAKSEFKGVSGRRDRVNFSAFAPPSVCLSPKPFQFTVWAFLLNQRSEMQELAKSDHPESRKLSLESKLDVRRGALVHVTLEVPNGFEVLNGATQGFAWEGDISSVDYDVMCTEGAAFGRVLFKARITVGSSVAVLNSFVLVGSRVMEPSELEVDVLEGWMDVMEQTYREIPFRSLEMKELVGQGYFGDAYRASLDGQDVVVKTIRASEFGDTTSQIVREFQHEAAMLNMFGHHPCIVPFVGASTDTKFPLALVTKYLPYGSLEDNLRGSSSLSIDERTGMLKDAAAGLLNIHEGGFIHRDLAARNCLVDQGSRVRICDFGLCRRMRSETAGMLMKDAVGPVKYMAPESLQPPHAFSYDSDVYMFGVLMWETFTSSLPFASLTPVEAMMHVLRGERLPVPKELPESLQTLMQNCFTTHLPNVRPCRKWSLRWTFRWSPANVHQQRLLQLVPLLRPPRRGQVCRFADKGARSIHLGITRQLEGIDTIQCRELQTERNAKIATENAFVFNATVDWLLSSGIVMPLASAQGKPSRINDAKMVALLRGSQKEELLHDRMEGDAQKVSWITTTDRLANETGLMDSGKPRCTYPGCMKQAQLKGLCLAHYRNIVTSKVSLSFQTAIRRFPFQSKVQQMASPRWTAEHDELLLSVAGHYSMWPERVQAFTNELHKRRDFLPMPEPAFTLPEIQNHLNELCEIAPTGPVKSLSKGWYPKRTELLQTIDNNTIGESNEVKTVLFNHAVKEKGWNFSATIEQVKWKLGRLPRNGQHTGDANVPTQPSSVQQCSGTKRTSTESTGTWFTRKRQNVGNYATTNSFSVADDAENDANLVDNGYKRGYIVTVSDGSDIEHTGGDAVPTVVREEPVPSPDSGDSAGTTKARENIGNHGHQRVEIKVRREVRTELEQTSINSHKETSITGGETMTAHLRLLIADVSRATFLALVEYVYTDQVNVSSDNVELFVAADRFGIESLKKQCSKKLLESLCIDNAAKTLLAAIQHNDPVLRDTCFSFTLRNLEKVSKTKSFHEMAKRDPEMVVKIVQKVSTLVHIA
ncbi:Tyrosine-protein kinase, catalytic domain [Phytophthora cactorum]|nr:Tyrosine-protein kinase, catalytic domain [Phytophthora cactorum]